MAQHCRKTCNTFQKPCMLFQIFSLTFTSSTPAMDSLAIHDILSPWQEKLVGVVLSILAIIGFLGNLMITIIFGNIKLAKTSTNILICNLAIADMLQCVNLLFMIAAVNDITWYKIDAWCKLNGFANHLFMPASLSFLTLICVNRYFVVVKNGNIFTRRKAVVLCIFLIWLYSSLLAISPLVGWSKYIFYPNKLICSHDTSKDRSFNYVTYIPVVIIYYPVLCFCSSQIWIAMKRSRQRIQEHGISTSRQGREDSHVTNMLLVVTVTFFMFYAPVWIINILPALHYKVEPGLNVFGTVIIMMNYANNPVIYGLMNGNFRKAGLKLFCWRKARNTSVQESQVQTTESSH